MANGRFFILLLAFGLTLKTAAQQPGSLDASFNTTNGPFRWTGAPVQSAVWSVLPLRNGQVLVGGPFEQVEGLDWRHLARLNADGSLDRTFTARPNRPVRAMIEQPDGRILIAGEFNGVDNQFRDRVARLEPDGSLDTNFPVRLGLNGIMHALALQPDGKVIVGGAFHVARDDAPWIHNIIRLETNGLIDFTFDPGTNLFTANLNLNFVRAVAVLPDGKIMAGGTFNRAARSGRDYLARLLPDGALDPAFGGEPFPGPSGPVYAMAAQAGGFLVIGGSFTKLHGVVRTNLARLLPDGSVDETFVPPSIQGGGLINALAVDTGCRVLAVSSASENTWNYSFSRVFRFDASGRIDTSHTSRFVDQGLGIASLALSTDGRTYIGGTFDSIEGVPRRRVALLLGDPPGPPVFSAQPTNQIVDAGLNVVISASVSVSAPTALQWFKDGESLPVATNVPLLLPFAMPTNSGQHWLVASNSFGVATSVVASVLVNDPLRPGAVDLFFAPKLGANSNVWELVSAPEGGIYVGGEFTRYDTNPVGRLIRIDEAGTIDIRFLPSIGSGSFGRRTIGALGLRADGNLLVAGYFHQANGQPANHILALRPDGPVNPTFTFRTGISFHTGYQGFFALNVDESGRVLVGGGFSSFPFGADLRRYYSLFRLFGDGSIDSSFRFLPTGSSAVIHSIGYDDQGQILVGGNSYTADDYGPAWDFMRLNTRAAIDLGFRFNGFGRCQPAGGVSGDCGIINAVLALPDGSLVAGGEFGGGTLRGPDCPGGCPHSISNLVRFARDGRVDLLFTTNSAPNRTINTAALQPDGKLIIAGTFTSVGGILRNGIARLNRDGTCDVSWHPGAGANGPIEAVLIRDDGQIAVGGRFTSFNGHWRGSVALLNGGPVEPPHLISPPTNLTVLAGTPLKLSPFIGGYPPPAMQWLLNGVPIHGENRAALRRDPSQVGQSGIYSLVLSNATGVTTAAVASVSVEPPSTHAGFVDPNFFSGLGADGEVMAIVVQSDGRIVLGGTFRSVQGVPRTGIARLQGNGALDLSYNPGAALAVTVTGAVSIAHLVLQPDGRTLLSGAFTRADGSSHQVLTRLNVDGSLDTGFATMLRAGIGYPIAIQKDEKVLLTIGGIFSMNGVMRTNLVRLHPDGNIDESFLAPSNLGSATALAIQADGRILVARDTVYRLLPNGSRDPSFTPISGLEPPAHNDPCVQFGDGGIIPPWIYALKVQPDGSIIIGGAFFLPNSAGIDRRANLLRLLPSGAVDQRFNASSNHYSFVGPNYVVRAIATEPDGRILIGGCFTAFGGANPLPPSSNLWRNHIARLNPDGSLEPSFNPGAAYSFAGDGYVRAIALQPDGRILVGGAFDTVDGVRRNNFARLTGDIVLFETASDDALFTMRVATTEGRTYWLEMRESAESGDWTAISNVAGDGTDQVLTDSLSNAGRRFYRVRVE